MDVRDFIADSIVRTRAGTLDLVQGLTPEQLTWQIAPQANTIGFLLFHTLRVEDYFLRVLGAEQELWRRDGWDQRWTLPEPPDDVTGIWFTGNSWTAEDVASFQPPPLDEMLAYGEAVRAAFLDRLRSLDLSRLHDKVWPRRNPTATVARVLQMVVHHESEHQGHIGLLLGLLRSSESA